MLSSSCLLTPSLSSLMIVSCVQVKAACTYSLAFCLTYSFSPSQTVTLDRPATPLLPSTKTVYSSTISNCEDLVVDASSSTGSGGRKMWCVRITNMIPTDICPQYSVVNNLCVLVCLHDLFGTGFIGRLVPRIPILI